MSTNVERWRSLVHKVAEAARINGLPTPTDAQLLGQIDVESGGNPIAQSPIGAVGLGQVMSNLDLRFPTRPGPKWLQKPLINLAFMIQLMGESMIRARTRGDHDPWRSALLEYYTGSLDGWDLEFGGVSGNDYVAQVKGAAQQYARPPWQIWNR